MSRTPSDSSVMQYEQYDFADFKLADRKFSSNFVYVTIPGNKSSKRLIKELMVNIEGLVEFVRPETDSLEKLVIRKDEHSGDAVIKLFFSNQTAPVAQIDFGDEYNYMIDSKAINPWQIKRAIFSSSFGRDTNFSIVVGEDLDEKEACNKKVKRFMHGCEEYHKSYKAKSANYDAEGLRLVVGENHEDNDATRFIIDIMPQIAERKAVIFLEFFE
jgi:hypothetical protein